MFCHMLSWEQYYLESSISYTEHHRGGNWSGKKRDRSRQISDKVDRKLRKWLVLLDNSWSFTNKKWLYNKKHLPISTIKLNFNPWYALFCQKTFKISRSIVRVTPEVLSTTEVLSASIVKRLDLEQGRFLKR